MVCFNVFESSVHWTSPTSVCTLQKIPRDITINVHDGVEEVLELPYFCAQSTRFCSESDTSFLLFLKCWPSRDPVAENAQHDPHCIWFFTGVTYPFSRQSTLLGASKSSTSKNVAPFVELEGEKPLRNPSYSSSVYKITFSCIFNS